MDKTILEKYNARKAIHDEIAKLKSWLSSHDYLINKHTLGEISDDDLEWVSYLAERKEKIKRINELESNI